MNEINDTLAQLTSLGPEALTVVAVIVVGYVLRLIPKFNNDLIPAACCLMGALGYPGLATKWNLHNVIVGLVLGFLAWTLHDKIISKIEAKIPLLNTLLNSTPDAPPPPPPPATGKSL